MIYRFADCELDDGRYELRRRDEVVELPPKALRLLLHLLRHRDRVVTREELLSELWGGIVVSDSALSTTIKKVRRAVGDGGARQQVIATRRGVGLRVVAPVEVVDARPDPPEPAPSSPREGASAAAPRSEEPFVGRVEVRARLEQLVREARAGRGRLALVEGEAGIGKSALVEETTRHARAEGLDVLRSCCWDGEGDPPLWLWSQTIGRIVEGLHDDELETVLGPAAPRIALLVPSLRLRLPELPPPDGRGGADTEVSRVELFDAIASVLAGTARARGALVLLLEDVHWARPASLQMLRYLAAQIGSHPLLVLATRRPPGTTVDPPSGDALAGLMASRATEWIQLEGLERKDLAELVGSWVGAPPGEAAVGALEAGTRGNPLLAREVVRALRAAGADLDEALPTAFASGGLLAAAPALRRILAHRIGQLSASARSLLETASVVGVEFELGLLCRATALPAREVLQALDEASEAHVVEPADPAGQSFRFVHALFREGVLECLGVTRRTDLHRCVGEALEAAHAGDRDAVLEALAHHFGRAAPVLDDLRAFEWACRAGDRAAAVMAHEDAVRWFENARRALDLRPEPDPGRRAAILIRLASALLSTGESQRARSSFREAAAAARSSGNAPLFAMAAYGFAGIQLGTPNPEATALLEEAIAALGPADSPVRVWGMTALLVQRASEGGSDASLREQAAANVAMAERLGSASTRVTARAAEAVVERNLPDDDLAARCRRIREASEIAREAGDPWLRMMAGVQELSASLEAGRLLEAEQLLAGLGEGGPTRSSHWRWVVPGFLAMRAVTRGRWDEALSLAERAFARTENEIDDDVALGVVRAEVDRECARLEGTVSRASDLVDGFRWNPYLRAALARALLDSGRRAEAQSAVDALALGGFAPLVGSDSWRAALWLLVGVCARLGDDARLEVLREHLLPLRSRCAVVRNLALCLGSVSHALGVAAGALGRPDEACELFEEAAGLGIEVDAPVWTVRARVAQSCVLTRRDARGDGARAEALLREAETLCETVPWPRLHATLSARRPDRGRLAPTAARPR